MDVKWMEVPHRLPRKANMIRAIMLALLLASCAAAAQKPSTYAAVCKPAGGMLACQIFPVDDNGSPVNQ